MWFDFFHNHWCKLSSLKSSILFLQTVADDLIKKWRKLFKIENVNLTSKIVFEDDCSSDDDVPITKYAKNYDSGIDLTEEEKTKIRDEVTRMLNMKKPEKREEEPSKRKQKVQKKKGLPKKKKVNESVNMCVDTLELESIAPEVVFADVNDIKGNQNLDVKVEITNTLTPLGLYLFNFIVLSGRINKSSITGEIWYMYK